MIVVNSDFIAENVVINSPGKRTNAAAWMIRRISFSGVTFIVFNDFIIMPSL
jgi:hypothetical protein